MDKTLLLHSVQSITYAPGIGEEIASIRPLIEEVIDIALREADRFSIAVRRVRVHRFLSREVRWHTELVITFFSDADRAKLVEFFPRLAERVGTWRRKQSGSTRENFADQLAVNIMPTEFWEDVRS